MKYKTLAALAVAAMMSASSLLAMAAAPYTDLDGVANRDSIDYLYDTHCLTFVTGNTFEPQAVLTRGELAQLIYNAAANMPIVNPEFSDVQSGNAADTMAAVAAQGILQGYEDGSFHPDEPVSREEFATVIYNYLKYSRMADKDTTTITPYADESQIAPSAVEAIDVLHSKNIMVPADNLFRPKEGITRADAVEVVYHLLHSDGQYVSHVQVETEVMKALNAEYGSVVAYFRQGTMYWNGDTLVLGMTSSPSRYFSSRLQTGVSQADAVVIRRVRLARNDYDSILNRAVNSLVANEGVQNYVGAVPDYIHEQVVITVRHPVSARTIQELIQRIGSGLIRIETVPVAGQDKVVQNVTTTTETADKTKGKDTTIDETIDYSPRIAKTTAKTIDGVLHDTMNS